MTLPAKRAAAADGGGGFVLGWRGQKEPRGARPGPLVARMDGATRQGRERARGKALPSTSSGQAAVATRYLSRSIGESARLFVAFENLTDTKIVVNRSPLELLGTPFQVRGGIYLGIRRR